MKKGEGIRMTKLDTLSVPEELGVLLVDMELGKSCRYFTMIDALFHYWDSTVGSPIGDFIAENKKELIEVILGSRGYRIEKPVYYALIKGHELLADEDAWACNYWNLSVPDGRVFPSDKSSADGLFSTKMTKSKWNKVGINDSNADFIKVVQE